MKFLKDKTAGLVTPRMLILLVLLFLPILVYGIVAAFAIWRVGWMIWVWWLGPIAWAIAWIVAKLWPAPVPEEKKSIQAIHWTPRDEEAAEIVQKFQEEVDQFTTDQLTDIQFYWDQSQIIAHALARHYHPDTSDPISGRTVPEILAACRLVADDLEELAMTSIPGSRMLTINQWRKLAETPNLVRQLTKGYWAAKILFNPFNLAQWGTSKATNEQVTGGLQMEILKLLYLRFVRQLGYYLIEMNSGRLRGGADAYRATFQPHRNVEPISGDRESEMISPDGERDHEPPSNDAGNEAPKVNGSSSHRSAPPTVRPKSVEIAVLGQRGSGKSSLICAMLDSQPNADAAKPKVSTEKALPTKSIEAYDLSTDENRVTIRLIDTPGYEPNTKGKVLNRTAQFAVENAHAILLVLNAQDPDWTSDRELLIRIDESYRTKANLRPPTVIAVLTHMDRLAEEELPIDSSTEAEVAGETQTAVEVRAVSLAKAIEKVQTELGSLVDDVVPVCSDLSSAHRTGVNEALLPTLAKHLDGARSAALLAAYEATLNQGRFKVLFQQARTSAKSLFSNWKLIRGKKGK